MTTPPSSSHSGSPSNVDKRTSWTLSRCIDNLQLNERDDAPPSVGGNAILRSAIAINRERHLENRSVAVPFRMQPDAPLGTLSLNDGEEKTRTKDKRG